MVARKLCSQHPAIRSRCRPAELAVFRPGCSCVDGPQGTAEVIPGRLGGRPAFFPIPTTGRAGDYGLHVVAGEGAGTGFQGVVQPEGSYSAQGAGRAFYSSPSPAARTLSNCSFASTPPRRKTRRRPFQFGKLLSPHSQPLASTWKPRGDRTRR